MERRERHSRSTCTVARREQRGKGASEDAKELELDVEDELEVGGDGESGGDHRASCHRCGNMRKKRVLCVRCPHIYCRRCEGKMIEEFGVSIFDGGCPVCKELCCCGKNRTFACPRTHHCYKKCPSTKRHLYKTAVGFVHASKRCLKSTEAFKRSIEQRQQHHTRTRRQRPEDLPASLPRARSPSHPRRSSARLKQRAMGAKGSVLSEAAYDALPESVTEERDMVCEGIAGVGETDDEKSEGSSSNCQTERSSPENGDQDHEGSCGCESDESLCMPPESRAKRQRTVPPETSYTYGSVLSGANSLHLTDDDWLDDALGLDLASDLDMQQWLSNHCAPEVPVLADDVDTCFNGLLCFM